MRSRTRKSERIGTRPPILWLTAVSASTGLNANDVESSGWKPIAGYGDVMRLTDYMGSRKANPYDPLWAALRAEGLEHVGRKAIALLPPAPVVASKAKRGVEESVSFDIAHFSWEFDSWALLQEFMPTLVVAVASMFD